MRITRHLVVAAVLFPFVLPSQEVADASVYFEVQPGTLADVRVNGQSKVAAKLLTSAFADQQGQPVVRERVESAMYLINDLPGLDAQGSFVAGRDEIEGNCGEEAGQVVGHVVHVGGPFGPGSDFDSQRMTAA